MRYAAGVKVGPKAPNTNSVPPSRGKRPPIGPTEAAVGLVNGLWQRTPIANGCDAINLLRGIYLGGYVPTRRRDARLSRGFTVRRRSCSFLLQWRGVPITLGVFTQ